MGPHVRNPLIVRVRPPPCVRICVCVYLRVRPRVCVCVARLPLSAVQKLFVKKNVHCAFQLSTVRPVPPGTKVKIVCRHTAVENAHEKLVRCKTHSDNGPDQDDLGKRFMLTDDPTASYVVQGRGIHAILLDTWSAEVVEKKPYVDSMAMHAQ